jgi:hypothetical protein
MRIISIGAISLTPSPSIKDGQQFVSYLQQNAIHVVEGREFQTFPPNTLKG